MTEQMQRQVEHKSHRRMLITLVVLLITLGVVLVKDRAIWFGSDDGADADETSTGSVPNSVAKVPVNPNPAPSANTPSTTNPVSATKNPAPTTSPVPTTKKKNEVAAKSPAQPAAAGPAVVAATRTELPPMEVEVVAGDTHRTVHPGSNSVKVVMPPHSGSKPAETAAFTWSPVTNAAERTRMPSDRPESLQTAESTYPSLARQMKVQGSVLLQAFVGTDGGIRDLRVLSGNPILVSAALEAARQWRFTPYLQNGQPVETQAKIMINFTIKVL